MHIFENEEEINNGNAIKMSLQSVNIGMTEAGNSPVAAELYFRVLM